jgi:predicted AlkP superfamily phosphohydrolase/phosphomutase
MTDETRTFLIGLDGATYNILDPLVASGHMPNLARLFERGSRAALRSTAHPLTPPAWTSLMTGHTPGHHGVFDFIRVDQHGDVPSYTLANSSDVQCETIWSIASRQGRRIISLNFPMMFPAPKLDGFIIPGYVPWSYLGRAIHPKDLFRRLKERGNFDARELSTDWQQERNAVQGLAEDDLEEWVNFHIVRERRWFDILMYLIETEHCPLTSVLFDGVDRIQHLCYHLLDPATAGQFTSPNAIKTRQLGLQYFGEVDGYIGKIMQLAGDTSTVLIASDHGFVRAGDTIFYANTWLESMGYLRWIDGVPYDDQGRLALDENTEVGTLLDWSATTAYSLSSSGNAIYIRKAEGPGRPGVSAEDYPAFRARLIDQLMAVRDPTTGQPVVAKVMTREEAFPGGQSEQAPDLTLVMTDLSFLSVLRADAPIKPRRTPYGTHHPDGVFIAAGPGIRAGFRSPPLSICDVAATALYSIGAALPADLEGVVPEGIFAPGHFERHPIRYEAAGLGAPMAAQQDERLSPEAEAQIRDRLKALGYL